MSSGRGCFSKSSIWNISGSPWPILMIFVSFNMFSGMPDRFIRLNEWFGLKCRVKVIFLYKYFVKSMHVTYIGPWYCPIILDQSILVADFLVWRMVEYVIIVLSWSLFLSDYWWWLMVVVTVSISMSACGDWRMPW